MEDVNNTCDIDAVLAMSLLSKPETWIDFTLTWQKPRRYYVYFVVLYHHRRHPDLLKYQRVVLAKILS